MSDETPGAAPGALPPREGHQVPRPTAERPTMRLTQVAGGQYVITSQSHGGVPALAQISPSSLTGTQGGVTRIISISPSRGQASPLRPSLANQSIVDVLTKSRGNSNIRLQLFQNSGESSNVQQHHTMPPSHSRTIKRPSSSTPEKKDPHSAKLQRVMNHRIVRSKIVKEKYAEHLLEAFYLEAGGNILDLYQYAKRPKSQAYLTYLKEHVIDPKGYAEEPTNNVPVPQTTPSLPSATSASSLPGISYSHQASTPAPAVSTPVASTETVKTSSVKTPRSSATPTNLNQEQIVEKAKQEAYVVQRISDLQKEGLWSEKRLPKVQDMSRSKAHWDFLLEEMVWLAADFAQERKWKKAAAKKCARMVQKYFQDKALAAQRAEKAHEQHLRRIASFCAKEIKNFWNNVEKLVEYKQHTILEEKRKKALDQQLSFIVDQTEKYSQLLAEGMNKSQAEVPSSVMSSRSVSRAHSDEEFDPEQQSDEDDEETIEQEEAALGEASEQKEEVAALQRESQMELDDLLEDDLLREYLLNRDNIRLSESEDSDDDPDDEKKDKPKKVVKDKKELEVESKSESEEFEEDEQEEALDSDDSESEDETEEAQSGTRDELKMLVDDVDSHVKEGEKTKTDEDDDLINDAAAIAESIQPKGNTLSSTSVSTKVPFLLKFPLREYQHIGLDWLVTMYDRKLNGILADEMGLGKTIQTIALLAHLACEKGDWGPHLIVVPTSVMLNWEMECKKWCPAFKILTYYGTQKERKLKRTGWTKPNAFHICITSYKLVIQDHQSFRRKKWKYLILDEAQNIKNFKSQRWQLLLNFQTERRLLLTGTPLQNNLMELWSLMHFLMPNVFQSHREFKEWFSNPVTGMIEGNSEYNESIIKRLHKVLRPFLLRRLKSEVEKQMPKKYEHVVMCRLSKRQRFLYEDYMSRAKTRETLASGNLLSVINVLMQLRKVCNHPNLFEVRPTISPFQCEGIRIHVPSLVYSALDYDPFKHIDLNSMNLLLIMLEMHLGAYRCYRMRQSLKKVSARHHEPPPPPCPPCKLSMKVKKSEVADVKGAAEARQEKKDQMLVVQQQAVKQVMAAGPQNVKVKVSGVQLVSQQGIVKTIPVVNISQATASGGQMQVGTPVNVTSVLKPADKISASFAQLVQTSTGKHLLLTSNPNITGNIPVTTTSGGQKLTLLSKQPVSTTGNAGQGITKAYVKFQLTSVTTATTTNTVTASNSTAIAVSKVDGKTKIVSSDFIGQLYSKRNSLDVRWGSEEKPLEIPGEEDPKGERKKRLELMARINERRCSALPLYGRDFQEVIKIFTPNRVNVWVGGQIHCLNTLFKKNVEESTECLADMLHNPERRIEQLKDACDRFIFYVPAVKTSEPDLRVCHPPPSKYWGQKEEKLLIQRLFSKPATPLHHIASAMVTQFPDPRLIQYDCGKLQTLDRLLRKLKSGSHRALIFTQMTKMLDVLEAFLNFHGHIYLRLDGTTKVDQRQVLMERFNGDKRIFAFILSTRSGGVGVNLTGADTVIFYDSDWNPTMDAQAQDRCHRIGQTRDVHIYRLVSERTIEENILKKANQKRLLGDLAIEGGNFTTAFFKSSTIQDLFDIDQSEGSAAQRMSEVVDSRKERDRAASGPELNASDDKSTMGALETALAACEDDQDVQAARTAKAEAVADLAEFDENIPLEEHDKDKEPEISKAEQEINNVIEKLSPIERYAMKFIEETESAWSAEQLAAAEREIEEQKREWEKNRLTAIREEEERRARELEEEADIITFSREDAANQVSPKSKKLKSKKFVSRKTGKNIRKLRRRKIKKRLIRRPKRPRRLSTLKNEETAEDSSRDHSTMEDNSSSSSSAKVNGDTETSLESNPSDSDITLSTLKHTSHNHLDHNSPRTRSRGTVAINLWTLDVSPILPGVRPIKNAKSNSVEKEITELKGVKRPKPHSEDEKSQSDDETGKRSSKKKTKCKKDEVPAQKLPESTSKDGMVNLNSTTKICKVVLNDIIAEGHYKIPERDSSSEDSNMSTKIMENSAEKVEDLKDEDVVFKDRIKTKVIENESNDSEKDGTKAEIIENESKDSEKEETRAKIIENESKESEKDETTAKIIESESKDIEQNETEEKIENDSKVLEIDETKSKMIENDSKVLEIDETKSKMIENDSKVFEIDETKSKTIENDSKVVEIDETKSKTIENDSKVVEIHETKSIMIENELKGDDKDETEAKTTKSELKDDESKETDAKPIENDLKNAEADKTEVKLTENQVKDEDMLELRAMEENNIDEIQRPCPKLCDGESEENIETIVLNSSEENCIDNEEKMESETPKENIELASNIPKSSLDNGVDGRKKFPKLTNKRGSFKSPEGRKTFRKFSKSTNNTTLDGWLKKLPTKDEGDGETKEIDGVVVDSDSKSSELVEKLTE